MASTVGCDGIKDMGDNTVDKAFDGTTDKFACSRLLPLVKSLTGEVNNNNNNNNNSNGEDGGSESIRQLQTTPPSAGFSLTPSHNKLSIVEKIRIYANDNCASCDPISFLLEGQYDFLSEWEEIYSGDFLWSSDTVGDSIPRNGEGIVIDGGYDGGDVNLSFTEVEVEIVTNKNTEGGDEADGDSTLPELMYRSYRITFQTRDAQSSELAMAEVQLVGKLLFEDYPSSFPSSSSHPSATPSTVPSLNPAPSAKPSESVAPSSSPSVLPSSVPSTSSKPSSAPSSVVSKWRWDMLLDLVFVV